MSQEVYHVMSDKATVGEVVIAFLEECGVEAAFGVISIHNMPFLDAIGERGKIRYVCAKGEAGAVNMADAYARVSQGLGVAFTSTGTAAGNAAGAMVEAQTAGTPVLHITGQIDTPHLDKNHGFIHEAKDQLTMLKAVSKAAFRVRMPEEALRVFKDAVREALTAPMGPVSVEVPIDVQQAEVSWPDDFSPLAVELAEPNITELDALADTLAECHRPLLWLGGGARSAAEAVGRLAEMGFGVVTSVQGRGVLAENHPATLGAYNLYKPVEEFYGTCDAVVVAGSRLRSNESLKYKLELPTPHFQIDVDPDVANRPYAPDRLLIGDCGLALNGLADRLEGRLSPDPEFIKDLKSAKAAAIRDLREGIAPYEPLVDAVSEQGGSELIWVRDVTISNSTWGNRAVDLSGPRDGVHALGGGIGQGMQMAIGAAIAAPDRRVICLVGDGGLQVNIGELTTAVQENVNLVVILMNSRDYEVIKNIQDATYGGRRHYSDIYAPDFEAIASGAGWSYQKLSDLGRASTVLGSAVQTQGPTMIEVDMAAIGSYARAFGGPPVRAAEMSKGR